VLSDILCCIISILHLLHRLHLLLFLSRVIFSSSLWCWNILISSLTWQLILFLKWHHARAHTHTHTFPYTWIDWFPCTWILFMLHSLQQPLFLWSSHQIYVINYFPPSAFSCTLHFLHTSMSKFLVMWRINGPKITWSMQKLSFCSYFFHILLYTCAHHLSQQNNATIKLISEGYSCILIYINRKVCSPCEGHDTSICMITSFNVIYIHFKSTYLNVVSRNKSIFTHNRFANATIWIHTECQLVERLRLHLH